MILPIIKKLGCKVKNFDQSICDQNKYQIMINILILKFYQNQELKTLLLSTDNSILVEASPYDNIWCMLETFLEINYLRLVCKNI